MAKNKAKDGIVVNAGNGNYIPNIVRGGAAIPIGKKNFYYMQGRKHEQGGIDVGRNAKTGLEVEGEEVMKVSPKEVRVYSSVPFLQGNSPAELVMGGANPDAVFNAQEEFKDRNRINDDGTKYQIGGEKQNRQIGDSPYDDPTFVINKKITLRKKAGRVTGLNIGKNTFNVIRTLSRGLRILSPIAEIVQNVFPNKEAEYVQSANDYARNPIKFDFKEKGNMLKYGGQTKPKFEDWYKTVPAEINDTTNYNLRRAYELLPFNELEDWRNGKAHLRSIAPTSNGDYEFLKSKKHPTYNKEIEWFNSNDKNAIEFRNNYRLDNKDKYPKYIKKSKMGKLVSINGNVKNGLIHTPNQDALAYNKERKPRFNGRYSKPGLYNLELNTSINNNQDIIESINNETPRKGTNQSSSSSTGGVNNRTYKSAKPAVQRVNRLAPATNAEMAGIRRGLEPLLQNTIVDKLNKTVDNDLNVMPVQDDIAKTRNMDNILLGVNLGSSVLDAVMGNIYANQMHGYTAPNITAPTIKNPGEIKLNEEDLKDIPAPILMAAAKLKTRYNANPQLSKIEDDTRRIMGEIGRNTSNSRVALARKQRAALQGQQAKNEVYGRKENIETELINKDKLNQQEVTARNLARYDQYNQALAAQRANRARLRLAADTANIQNKLAVSTANAQLKSQADRFNTANKINQLVHQAGIDAAKAEARSNIFSGMLSNIGSALNTWNRNKRQAKLDEETLRVLGLLAPNANKLVLSALDY